MKTKKKNIISFLALLLCINVVSNVQAQLANSCNENKAQILILGTFHMHNPGLDTFNIEADDVLKPKRQQEISELLEKIARFNPTKILIESAYRDTRWTNNYKKYLAGEYELGRNEIEQLGFRLAKRFNHSSLYPIDFPMWMNGLMPNEIEEPKATAPKPTPSPSPSPKTEAPKQPIPAYIQKKDEIMRTGTILEILRHLNSQEYIKPSHEGYMNMLLPNDNIAIYARTDLVTNWYKRNLRMWTNINRVTEFPKDRVLLIVGSGHLKILRDFAEDSPYFCLADTQEYLK